MNTIKNFLIFCLLILLINSANIVAMEEVDFEAKKLLTLITPWIERKELAAQYMKEAIEANQIKEVNESFGDATLTTIFVPDTLIVELNLRVSPKSTSKVRYLSESVSYNFLIKKIDQFNKENREASNISVQKQNASLYWCSLQ